MLVISAKKCVILDMFKAMEKCGNCSIFSKLHNRNHFYWSLNILHLFCLHHIEYISTNYSSEIDFDWQNGGTFIQTWSLVEISYTCKDQKWQNLCANIVPGWTNNVFRSESSSRTRNGCHSHSQCHCHEKVSKLQDLPSYD